MKKEYWIGLLLLCGSGRGLQAQTDVWPVWAGQEDCAAVVDSTTEKGVVRLTEVKSPTLAVFRPQGTSNGVGVIVCPGGGYQLLAYDKEGTDVAAWLTERGYTAFVLAYRVPNRQAEALCDIQRSLRLVRSRFPELKKVGVMGFSAGASLSARAASRFGERTYEEQEACDTLSCRPDFAALVYPAYLDQGEGRTLTPELTLTEQTPPMFIFATADDFYGNSALVMAQALRDKKIPVELHFYAAGGHGYGMRRGPGKVWPLLLDTWMEHTVR